MLTLEQTGNVAIFHLDDGKANAVGHTFIDAMNDALDQAQQGAKAVVLHGRDGVFSGGFDLKEFQKGVQATNQLVSRGAHLLLRMFTHPQPIIAACTGHAVAAGAFMLLASDTRIGTSGAFKIGLNETAIGMTLPVFGLQLAQARLSKRHQTSAVIQANLLDPASAVDAGFLDDVVAANEALPRSTSIAAELAELPGDAYHANKLAMRAPYISVIEASLKD